MANPEIRPLKLDGEIFYPPTTSEQVIDPETNESVKFQISELNENLTQRIGNIKIRKGTITLNANSSGWVDYSSIINGNTVMVDFLSTANNSYIVAKRKLGSGYLYICGNTIERATNANVTFNYVAIDVED